MAYTTSQTTQVDLRTIILTDKDDNSYFSNPTVWSVVCDFAEKLTQLEQSF